MIIYYVIYFILKKYYLANIFLVRVVFMLYITLLYVDSFFSG